MKQKKLDLKVGDVIEFKKQTPFYATCKYKIVDIDSNMICYEVGKIIGGMENLGANTYRKIGSATKIDWSKEQMILENFYKELSNYCEPAVKLPKSEDPIVNSLFGETIVEKFIIS